jgi:hypothetical protein
MVALLPANLLFGQEKVVVGLIPKAQKAIKMNGRLDDFEGAFATPVHVGHPDFLNRGGEFLFLWDENNLYVGMRCLDQKPAHTGNDKQIWNGDAVEFYLDTRRGDKLGAKEFGPGTLHMFYTPFTGTEVKPRMQVRELPAFKDFKLEGAEVAGEKTETGYTAVFKLPWALFPDFKPKADEIIGIDCELCSSDGGPRVDRTFVYSGPTSVGTPSTFGRVKLVDKIDPTQLKPYGKVLLPMSLTKSTNYGWLYGNINLSRTIAKDVKTIEGKLLDAEGKVKATSAGQPGILAATGFSIWTGKWELNDLPHGFYTLEVTAKDKDGKIITQRGETIYHGEKPPAPEKPRERLQQETPKGRREKLSLGTLFIPEGLKTDKPVPLFIHFHSVAWIPEVAASRRQVAVISVQLGTGSAVYAKPFAEPKAFHDLLKEAEDKAGVKFGVIGLTAWSAGYGAVRAILQDSEAYERITFVLLIDGMHAGYTDKLEKGIVREHVEIFARFAADAVDGKKQMIVTHSEIVPGSYASTTETADYLLKHLGLRREMGKKGGPMKTVQLSEVKKGGFTLIGYAGNTAADHIDQLHSLPEYLKWVRWEK